MFTFFNFVLFMQKNYLCAVRISNVEEGDNWWYLSCIKCKDGEALKNDGNYKCSRCTLVMPVPEKR